MPTLPDDSQFDAGHESPQSSPSGQESGNGVRGLRLALPGAALLVTLGLFGYAISAGNRSDQAPVQSPSSAASAAKPGDFSPQAGWIKNFEAKLRVFSYEGSSAPLSGNGRPLALPPPTGLPEFVAAAVTGSGPADIRVALAAPTAAQSGKVHAAESEQAALHSLSVEFPGNSSKLPSRDGKTIRRVAELIKALPAGTAVELIGSTSGTTTSPRGEALAQRRAHSVYRALVRAGVNPAMLRPKGSGGISVQASAGMEGRSTTLTEPPTRRDRRVEFRVVELQR